MPAEPTPLLTPDERTKLAAGRDIGVAGNKRAAATIDALTDQVAKLKVIADFRWDAMVMLGQERDAAEAERDALKVERGRLREVLEWVGVIAETECGWAEGAELQRWSEIEDRVRAALSPPKPQEGGDAEGE